MLSTIARRSILFTSFSHPSSGSRLLSSFSFPPETGTLKLRFTSATSSNSKLYEPVEVKEGEIRKAFQYASKTSVLVPANAKYNRLEETASSREFTKVKVNSVTDEDAFAVVNVGSSGNDSVSFVHVITETSRPPSYISVTTILF